jgi:hypothetical protein
MTMVQVLRLIQTRYHDTSASVAKTDYHDSGTGATVAVPALHDNGTGTGAEVAEMATMTMIYVLQLIQTPCNDKDTSASVSKTGYHDSGTDARVAAPALHDTGKGASVAETGYYDL